MVGRGTRLDPSSNKLMFRLFNYTGAIALFGEDFIIRDKRPKTALPSGFMGDPDDDETEDHEPLLIISAAGFDVHITEKGHFVIMQVDGRPRPVPYEQYKAQLAERIKREAPTIEDFRVRWIDPRPRPALIKSLVNAGYSPSLISAVDCMSDYDLFDVLGQVVYQAPARTRQQRAATFQAQQAPWLDSLPPATSNTLQALARQFAKSGTDALESPQLFKLPAVKKAGGFEALQQVNDLPREIYQFMGLTGLWDSMIKRLQMALPL